MIDSKDVVKGRQLVEALGDKETSQNRTEYHRDCQGALESEREP